MTHLQETEITQELWEGTIAPAWMMILEGVEGHPHDPATLAKAMTCATAVLAMAIGLAENQGSARQPLINSAIANLNRMLDEMTVEVIEVGTVN